MYLPPYDDGAFASHLETHRRLETGALQRALAASRASGAPLTSSILELGLLEEVSLFQSLATYLDLDFADDPIVDEDVVSTLNLSVEYLQRVGVIPLQGEDDRLILATCDPSADDAIASIVFLADRSANTRITCPSLLKAALTRLSQEKAESDESSATDRDVAQLRAMANDGPIVTLVNEIISGAVLASASDIHIEADEVGGLVRYRIDGSLQDIRKLSNEVRVSTTSRLKVMANLNISERRRPQDGRLRVSVRGRNVDIRLSTLPTQHGESLVLRVLDRNRVNLKWSSLGFSEQRIEELENILKSPNGLFLVSGPTGSGKTTTLYTALERVNVADRKVVTVEDPIEFSLPRINQVQVEPQIDVTFGSALRAILRQDPDVVMVGEIRDAETAEIAVRAALVGRLVLSTIHTNDSLSAVARLLDLGIPPYLLAATLRGVLSQRLVRVICDTCAGEGCDVCSGNGRLGRTVVSELLVVDDLVSEAIQEGRSASEIKKIISRQGFIPMHEDAARLVATGKVASSDALRVSGSALYATRH